MTLATAHIDPSLFQRLAQGDEVAFRAVFDHYKITFHAAAFKMTRLPLVAEEIVQELFVNLWTQRAKLLQVEKPEAYLMKMLHNTVYAHFRRLMLEQRLRKKMGERQKDGTFPSCRSSV